MTKARVEGAGPAEIGSAILQCCDDRVGCIPAIVPKSIGVHESVFTRKQWSKRVTFRQEIAAKPLASNESEFC
jgi:hypothetical protein